MKLSIDDYGVVIKHADFQTYENDRFPIIADRTNNENAGLGNGRLRDGNGDDDAGSEEAIMRVTAMLEIIGKNGKSLNLTLWIH